MAGEPSYPDDAPIGSAPEDAEAHESVGAAAAAARAVDPKRSSHLVAGAAIGIGSAALVAALLYANRSRRAGDKREERAAKDGETAGNG